jgi:stage III sporulation protein AB
VLLRVCASALVLVGCGWLGMQYGTGFGRRVRQLQELQNSMMQFEYDIDYLGVPIEQTIEKLSKNSCGELKEVFLYMDRRLKNGPVFSMEKLWMRALERYEDNLMLTKSDVQIIRDFAGLLGAGSREKELNNIKVTSMRLKLAEDEARALEVKNSKMYRGLGLLLGVFIVVMLI